MCRDLESRIVIGSSVNSVSAKEYFEQLEKYSEARRSFHASLVKKGPEIPAHLKRADEEESR